MKQPDTCYNTDKITKDLENNLPIYIATYSDGSYMRHYQYYEYITPENLTAIWSISTKHKIQTK